MSTQPTVQEMADASNGQDINPSAGASAPSVLSQTVAPQMPSPQSPGSPEEQQMDRDTSGPDNVGGGSRLQAILSAVAKAVPVGVAGAANQKGRASFAGGMTGGATEELKQQAQQQATDNQIKMQDFNNSVRLANLHRQDLAQQQQDDAQEAAQQAAQAFQKEAFDDPNNLTYNPHPNDATAVTQNLQSQTQANGSASIPPGTHLNADGETINIPSNDPATLQAQVKKYKALEGVIPFLPSLPAFDPSSVKSTSDVVNARNDLGKHIDIMTHILEGHNVNGEALTHDQLNNLIPALQAQRDSLAKSGGANTYQLGTLDHLLGIYKANEQNHQNFEDAAAAKATKQKMDLQDNAEANKEQGQRNAAALKPQKPQSTDWVQGVSADEKKKAELAENMVYNANSVAALLQRRPDIVGAVAGRFTTLDQMKGANDPDIVQLATDIHNIGMANAGIHGLRSLDAANDYGKVVLNNFKNGPQGIYGGLKSSVDSVQTFIDNARPQTYKTHSKQGGAIRAMVPQAQGQQQ